MLSFTDSARRTASTFYDNISVPRVSYRPNHKMMFPNQDIVQSNVLPQVMLDRTRCHGNMESESLLLHQTCLPLQTQLLESTEGVDIPSRAKRQFVPNNKKDGSYWLKRCKNNDSARRSRFKRKCLDKILEKKIAVLQNENCQLKYELRMLHKQHSRVSSANAFSETTIESSSLNSIYGMFSHFQNVNAFPNQLHTEIIEPSKSLHSSGDENDTLQSSFTQESDEYSSSSCSPSSLSEPEAFKLMYSSSQFMNGNGSSDSNIWRSDRDDLTPVGGMERDCILQFREKVQKVPHKLRIKKNVRSIVETSHTSNDKTLGVGNP
ncbi:nuclear factor interleukin-3-regulated protein-like [Argopecten irradians]|uniref:nuclear factor interleukin-3-regulated protein-like n=1 Tax=Argopecten irradians TaxID=31199 RepID=UPI003712367C